MVVVIILFIFDIINTYFSNKQKYTNINTEKISNRIEKNGFPTY